MKKPSQIYRIYHLKFHKGLVDSLHAILCNSYQNQQYFTLYFKQTKWWKKEYILKKKISRTLYTVPDTSYVNNSRYVPHTWHQYMLHHTGPHIGLLPLGTLSSIIEDPSGTILMKCTMGAGATSGLCSPSPRGSLWRQPLLLALFPSPPASSSGHFQPTSPWLPDLLLNLEIPIVQLL